MHRRNGTRPPSIRFAFLLLLVATTPLAARAQSLAAGDLSLATAPSVVATSADGRWFELTISARQRHSAIFDPARSRMLVFGGLRESGEPGGSGSAYYCSDLWELNTEGTLLWRKLYATGTWPSGRYGHSAIYDPVRDRMLVWSGLGAAGGDPNVYALSFGDVPTWSVLATTGPPPGPGRYGHSAIYDPVRDRMLVFGGRVGSSNLNDVWELSLAGTPAWNLIAATGTPPPVRQRHSAVYDPVRDRMLVFGGRGASALNDVWELSLAGAPVWSPLASTGTPPSVRSDHAAVYDPMGDRMVVFGGGNLNDVWTLSLSGTPAWSPASAAGTAPAARSFHTAVLDPAAHQMVVFAGVSGDVVSDVQLLSLSAPMQWVANSFDETGPGPRFGHVSIHDPVRERLLVCGGWGNAATSTPNTVWSLSLSGQRFWTALAASGTPPPTGLVESSAVYDPVRDRMLVFGGFDGALHNQTWALSLADPPAWSQLSPTGTPPSGRMGHVAIYDPVRDRMVVHGGAAASNTNDVWALSLAGTPAWSQLLPSGAPPPATYDHAAAYDAVRDRLLRLQGWPGSSPSTYALSLADPPTWSSLGAGGIPASAYGQVAIYDRARDRVLALGGRTVMSTGESTVLGALALAEPAGWSSPAPEGPLPLGRAQHSAVYAPVADGVLVFGGQPAGSIGTPILSDAWLWLMVDPVFVPWPDPWALTNPVSPATPNPTREATTIVFLLAGPGRTRVDVYDVAGRLVRSLLDAEQPQGPGSVTWNGANDAGARQGAGVYFVRLSAPGVQATRRVVLMQ